MTLLEAYLYHSTYIDINKVQGTWKTDQEIHNSSKTDFLLEDNVWDTMLRWNAMKKNILFENIVWRYVYKT